MITTTELRDKYLAFFGSYRHAHIAPSSLLPENDPSALFISAGMAPLVPFLLGAAHPQGRRLTNIQRCLRTGDIDEVGDAWHLTFFEMLGNWSLGDYGKVESINYSWEFLTSPSWLGIDSARLAVSVFAGDRDAPRDEISASVWRSLGVPQERVHFLPKAQNWWGPVGTTGPCGPDTEIFFDTGLSQSAHSTPECGPACTCGRWVEIWNNVFMEYERKANGSLVRLGQPNVDTGMGLERTVAVLNGYTSVFETDLLASLVAQVVRVAPGSSVRTQRITADHLRAATFLALDGVLPSNKDQGYVLRRLLRKVMSGHTALRSPENLTTLVAQVVRTSSGAYPKLLTEESRISALVSAECEKFNRTFQKGYTRIQALLARGGSAASSGAQQINGQEAFDLYQTYGFPLDATVEIAQAAGVAVDRNAFAKNMQEHQRLSRAGAAEKFAGGLADHSQATVRLHTATHMLQAALRAVLGEHVLQKGSNITAQRLRFDFSHPSALAPAQLEEVQNLVNAKIQEDLPVVREVVTYQDGLARGAIGVLEARPDERVSIYGIPGFSLEFCGGPHVEQTREVGIFTITKQEAVAAGVRRIKAILR